MRKLALVLMAVTVALPLTLASAGAAPTVSRQQLAFAGWTEPLPTPNHFRWYFAFGSFDQHVGAETSVFAAVGKGVCIRTKMRRGVRVECGSDSFVMTRKPSAFEMNPLGSSARVSVRDKGRRHVARWNADNPRQSGFYTSEAICDDGFGHGGGSAWNTVATANMFGKKLRPSRWFDFSLTLSGAFVDNCSRELLSRLRSGEPIEFTLPR